MKGVRIFGVLLTVLLLGAAMSSAFQVKSYSSEYDVTGDEVQAILNIDFDGFYDDFVWQLPDDAQSITANVQSKIVKDSGEIFLVVNNSISNIEISFTSKSFIEKADGEFFILDLGNIQTAEKSVLLKLPEDAKLKYSLDSVKSSIIPKTDGVITDGRRIIIRWTKDDFAKNSAILVMYEVPNDNTGLILAILLVALVIVIVYFAFEHYKKTKIKEMHGHAYAEKKHEQKKEDDTHYTKNLFEDEKLVVQMLLLEKTRELWQKQLEAKTGLNKVKLSRKLRSLEAKGLIEKIPYGNTNKIRLKKN